MTSCLRMLIVGLLWACSAPLEAGQNPHPTEEIQPLLRFEFLQIRMAIPVRIQVYAADEATANQAAERAFARIKRLDRLLSDYDPDSELSRLCARSRPGRPIPVSAELVTVLKKAEEISRLSDGAFDVTVGPLTELWRKVSRRKSLPPDEERLDALSRVGWENVVLSEEQGTVELRQPGMQLDLGGIAKGYAADEALRVMAAFGVTRALVDAGGDIVAGDPPPGCAGWEIGIAPLDDPRGTPRHFLRLRNAAVATSGDASRHVEIDGVRYSHIVNPSTGMGVTTASSVTIVAEDGITADALASAVSVLGPQRGVPIIEQIKHAAAFVVTRAPDDEIRTYASRGLDRYLDTAPRKRAEDQPPP